MPRADRRCDRAAESSSEPCSYSGVGSSEIGRPALMRRCAKVGMRLQCSAPRSIGSIWTTASSGTDSRSHSNARCCARRDWLGPVKARAHPTIADVLGVVEVDGRRRDSRRQHDHAHERCHRTRARLSQRPQHARQQHRQHQLQDLAGAESDPRRLRQRQRVHQQQRKRDADRRRPASAAEAARARARGRPAPEAAPDRWRAAAPSACCSRRGR